MHRSGDKSGPERGRTMETLRNSYHGTEVQTRTSEADREAIAYRVYTGAATEAEKALLRRIRRTLCPSASSGCTCGDTWGIRG